jgi:itaconate CoA-transferase
VPTQTLPLAGLTVVAVEQAVAAPFATRQLADLGARVIKVEPPGRGDLARHYDRAFGTVSSYFGWLNRGKESVCLELASPAGRDALGELVARADVVVCNLAPDTAERLDLAPGSLVARHPGLVACEVRGYGAGSDRVGDRAYDLLIQCELGLADLTGSPGEPARVGISVADIAAGMYAFSGVLTALYWRRLTGRGQALSVSLFDALAEWMCTPAFYAWQTGTVPPRTGVHHPTIAPYGAYRVRDGVLVLGVQTEEQWRRLCQGLGRPDLPLDPRFADNVSRVAHRAALDEAVEAALRGRDRAEVAAVLAAYRIPHAGYRSVQELRAELAGGAGDRLRQVPGPAGEIWALLPPVRFGEFPARLAPVPALGEHTEAVLAELRLGRTSS